MILTRNDWQQALADGHITAEHVLQRLKNITVHATGEKSSMGFDEDGFVISLVAAGLTLEGGVTLRVYPNDHPPPHVHIDLRSHPGSKLRVRLDTGEFMDEPPRGVVGRKLQKLQKVIMENRVLLVTWWEKYQGGPEIVA